ATFFRRRVIFRLPSKSPTDEIGAALVATISSFARPRRQAPFVGVIQLTAGPLTTATRTPLKRVLGIGFVPGPVSAMFFASWKSDATMRMNPVPAGIGFSCRGYGKTATPVAGSNAVAPSCKVL